MKYAYIVTRWKPGQDCKSTVCEGPNEVIAALAGIEDEECYKVINTREQELALRLISDRRPTIVPPF